MRFNPGRSKVTCGTRAGNMSRAPFSTAPFSIDLAARCKDMGSSTIVESMMGREPASVQGGSSFPNCHACPEMVMIEPCSGRFQERHFRCRLVVSWLGLKSPPAPFRVGIAPTDSFLKQNQLCDQAGQNGLL